MNTKPETALDICNLALVMLGESPISGIDPNGYLAQRLCYMQYHPVRREVLCTHRWNFAKHETEIVSDTSIHAIPYDCLRVVNVNVPSWTLRGRNIVSYEKSVTLTYISDEEDVSLFEDMFVEMLATRLAMKLCIPLTNSEEIYKNLSEKYLALSNEQYC